MIIQEEAQHSQIRETVYQLADVRGPRLTGSPNALRAAKWALAKMASWGLQHTRLEPWQFGHVGWTNRRASGYVLSPVRQRLDFRVVAWTPGTKGEVSARVVQIAPPAEATHEQLAGYLAGVRDRVRGKIVLVGSGDPVEPDLGPVMRRLDQQYIAEQLNPDAPWRHPAPPELSNVLSRADYNNELDRFLIAAGAVMRVNDAHLPNGEIRAYANSSYDPSQALPTVVLASQDFGRAIRLLSHEQHVAMSFDIDNEIFRSGKLAYNAFADLRGSDKGSEVVMIGAHLDSWHSATGATDDAVGCAIMMEAARILATLKAPLRRTVRVALWTGEEQGLLGSQAYVATHFGTAEIPQPEFARLAAYINLDGGTGRIRTASVFGPSKAGELVNDALSPFRSMGVAGAISHGIRRLRSTDSTTFSRAGLPAIGFSQDPINYERTWHSNLDTSDQILLSDAQQAAEVVAVLAYFLANSDEPLPRFGLADMPRADGPAPVARSVKSRH